INGADFVTQPGESLSIRSRSATAIEDLRSCGQSLDKFLALGLDELVGLFEMPTVVVRTFVIGLFNMRIMSVFSFHLVIVARHGRAMEGISGESYVLPNERANCCRGRVGYRIRVESTGCFGDRLQHGWVRHADTGLHARRHFRRSRVDKCASGFARHVDNALGGLRWAAPLVL